VFINFASFRRSVFVCLVVSKIACFCLNCVIIICKLVCSAAASSMSALKQPTVRVVAIIAEGVPEADAKQLIAYARANNKARTMMQCYLNCNERKV